MDLSIQITILIYIFAQNAHIMSKVNALFHIVFATKDRRPFLLDTFIEDLHKVINDIIISNKSRLHSINSVTDHLHMLVDLNPTVSISELIAAVKACAHNWMKTDSRAALFNGWCSGYYACSCSPSHKTSIETYILRQTEHHAIHLFDKEIQKMCDVWNLSYHPEDLK